MGPRSNSSLRGTCQYLRPWQTGTECCPPGMKTGDQISPPGGYVGGGLQMQTDLAISPSGDVWVIKLAGHRQLLQRRQRGVVNALRRPRRRGLFRHGQAGAFAADQAGAAVLAGRKRRPAKGDCLMRRRSTVLCAFVALALAALVGMPARAQEKLSAEELAKLAPNPVGNLISVPFQNNTNLNSGRRRGRRTSSTSSRSFRSR